MREEVLRLDRVTCLDQGAAALNHLSLSVFAGEIMGLLPINSTGLPALLRLLCHNTPLHYGYVYYRERLVNHWEQAHVHPNRISVIENRSGLADDLTVADNVFVLRPGFKKQVIRRGMLRSQLAPFLLEIGVSISADAYARDLTTFERFVVELVKAVVAGNRLIILLDAGTFVSEAELHHLHTILRHYAAQGISFLYVSQHFEETRQVCRRAAVMVNGRIAKVLTTADTSPQAFHCFGVETYESLVTTQRAGRPAANRRPVFAFDDIQYGAIDALSLSIDEGECIVLQDLDNLILDDLSALLTGQATPRRGGILVGGRPLNRRTLRDIALIQKFAPATMLFPDLSYLDNLCFMMDHRLPKVWINRRCKAGIAREHLRQFGGDVFDTPIEALSPLEKYDLIYARAMLQRPRVVFCVQPFMQGDVAQRMHIWKLLETLLEKKIAVVILAVNLADTLSLADRLVQVQDGKVLATCLRQDFGALPENTPWHHLWQGQEDVRAR